MTEIIRKKLSDSVVARWSALAIVSFTMLCGYFLSDVMSPLKTMLEGEPLLWSSADFGWFNFAYSLFNVYLFMLIIGGMVLDRVGIRITGLGSCLLMVIGCFAKYYAVVGDLGDGTVFGLKNSVALAALGFGIFAVGIEMAGITVTKIIVKWFKGKEMALAMGMQVATARIGTILALSVTVPLAKYFDNIGAPILLCLVLLCIGTISYFLYCIMDKKLDESAVDAGEKPEDPFVLSDVVLIITNKGFWLIALLCVLFYSAVFPFLKYATDLMVNKYNMDIEQAGLIPALLPFGTLLLTPVFGAVYDKLGKGASIMIFGSCLLIGVHVLFALPLLNVWWFAAFIMIILGVAFSLVPSALWPSVAKIIPEKQLGTAYGLIFWVQNIGLGGVPLLIGIVLDKYCKLSDPSGPAYDYTLPMAIFACFGVLALFVAFMLKREDKIKGYGLEQPNLSKK